MNRQALEQSPDIAKAELHKLYTNQLISDSILKIVEQTVSTAFEVRLAELRSTSRGNARAAFARQIAMYLTHVCCGISLTGVGRLYHRDRITVAHACSVVEDRRDDPKFDRIVNILEAVVSSMCVDTLPPKGKL